MDLNRNNKDDWEEAGDWLADSLMQVAKKLGSLVKFVFTIPWYLWLMAFLALGGFGLVTDGPIEVLGYEINVSEKKEISVKDPDATPAGQCACTKK